MYAGRDDDKKIYPCMAMPPDLRRVDMPEDDPKAKVAKSRGLLERIRPLKRVPAER